MADNTSAAAPAATKARKPYKLVREFDGTKHTVIFRGVNPIDTKEHFAITVDCGSLTREIRDRLEVHGAGAKIGDTCAGVMNAAYDSGTDPFKAAKEEIDSILIQLKSGKWADRAAGGGSVRFSDLVQPLVALGKAKGKPTTAEGVVAKLAEMSASQLAAVRARPDVIAEMAKLAKSAPAPVGNLDDLLSA